MAIPTKYSVLLIGLLFVPLFSFSQQNCNCCTANHDAFDFWVGTWEVYDTVGNKVGENVIKRIEKGCALQENWSGASGVTGQSMNYFDPADSTWNQLWVSSSGTVLKLKGGIIDSVMLMKSEIIETDSTNYYHQIKWSQAQDSNDVIQEWTTRDEEGKLLKHLFKGVYVQEIREPIEFR